MAFRVRGKAAAPQTTAQQSSMVAVALTPQGTQSYAPGGGGGGGITPTTITTLTVTETSGTSQTNAPITFGHYFAQGNVPAAATLSATATGGANVPLQVDKKATWSDGTLRHAVLTARIPTLAASGSTTLTLATANPGAVGAAITKSNILATAFDATVTLTLFAPQTVATITRVGSTATATVTAHGWANGSNVRFSGAGQVEYTGLFLVTVIDANTVSFTVVGTPATPATGTIRAFGGTAAAGTYLLSARDLLSNAVLPILDTTHQSGPECSEFIVGAALRSGATPHTHLAAYFHIRAYAGLSKIRCDVVVENGWTFVPGSGIFSYAVAVSVGGAQIYSSANLGHYNHSRWHALGWYGAVPPLAVAHNRNYLKASKAVPNYGATPPNTTVLNSYATYSPMGTANLRARWGDTGYSPQIGPVPEWYASCLKTTDVRAYDAVLANDSAGGSYGYHYRDETTGYMPSIDTYPTLSEQGPSGGLVIGQGGNKNEHDVAHAPLIGYLGYLLTGDFYYLEEMQFLANYHLLWSAPGPRGNAQGVLGSQNRSQAWGMRTLGYTASLTPDAHPLKTYLVNKTNNNITNKTTTWASPPANALGAIQDYDWDPPNRYQYSPWQNDFFVSVVGHLVELGFAATTLRNWLAKWPTGRMGQDNNGYCYVQATQYNFPSGIVKPDEIAYNDNFLQLYQENYPTESQSTCPVSGPMQASAYPDNGTGYYAQLCAASAIAVDAGVMSVATWNKLKTAGTIGADAAPVWDVVPRTIPTLAIGSNLVPGRWYEFPTSFANSVDPALDPAANPDFPGAAPWRGSEGFAAIIDSWSGGAFDTLRNRLIVGPGGGHAAYAGNEILAFDIALGTWARLINPSTTITSNTAAYPDGKPTARHSYNSIQYLPTIDCLLAAGIPGGYGPSGYFGFEVWAFSFATNTWVSKAPIPSGAGGASYPDSAIDANGDHWHKTQEGPGRLLKYTVATNTWTTHAALPSFQSAAAIDTKRNIMVSLRDNDGNQRRFDLNNPNTAPVLIPMSGPGPTSGERQQGGFIYDPIGDRYIWWNGGATLLQMDPITFAWSVLPLDPGNTFTPPGVGSTGQWRGAFGRFRYVPATHGLIAVTQVFHNVVYFQL